MVGYDNIEKYALCDCEIKNEIKINDDFIIDKDKLLKSLDFSDIKSLINLEVMKCYYILFEKSGLLYNIGNYILLFSIFIYALTIIIFLSKGYISLINQINDIIFINKKSINKIKNEIKNNKNKINNKNKNIFKFNEKKIKKINNKNKNIAKFNDKKLKKIDKQKNNKNKKKVSIPPKKNRKNKKLTNKTNHRFKLGKALSSNNKSLGSKLCLKNNEKIVSLNIDNIHEKKTKNIFVNMKKEKNCKIKNIVTFIDYELNRLVYIEALKYDKRTFCQYYFSLLKTKNILLFSFCPNKDYNSQIIKIFLFFFFFDLYYTINTLFFTENIIHDIHLNSGKFEFLYHLPQIIYSSIISTIINLLIRYFSLTQRNILEIKYENNSSKNKIEIPKSLYCIKIKLICFFIISYIFLIFFWYYLSCFCAVYRNSQLYLILDSLYSFGMSLLYPFAICLFPGFFRIPSLRNKKKNKECLYNFSKIIQYL